MKKLIAVTASILLASSAFSANASSLKLDEISNFDLIGCVKENCSHKNENDCKIMDLLGSLIDKEILPEFNKESLNDIISSILGKLPSFKPETDAPSTDTVPEEKPDVPQTPPQESIPEENLPEEKPETEKPETILPEKPESDGGNPDSGYISNSEYVNEVLRLVNKYRNENGLASVKLDASLCKAAEIRAKESKTSFSHTRPNGQSCFTVLSELGISYGGAGENIAYGQSSPNEVMTAWMNSSGHRANILGSSFTKLGIGVYSSGGTLYWAQMFAY